MNHKRRTALVARYFAQYGAVEPIRVQGYLDEFDDMTDEALEFALRHSLRINSSGFPESIGKLRSYIFSDPTKEPIWLIGANKPAAAQAKLVDKAAENERRATAVIRRRRSEGAGEELIRTELTTMGLSWPGEAFEVR